MVNMPSDDFHPEQAAALSGHDRLSAQQQIIPELEQIVDRITSSVDRENKSRDLIAGIARVSQISTQLNDTASLVINGLPRIWEEERQQRHTELNNGILQRQQTQFLTTVAKQIEQQQTEFITRVTRENEQLKILNQQAIDRIIDIKAKIWSLLGAGVGSLVTLGLAWSIIFPHQLDNARGADSEIVRYLSTTEGKLMQRSFTSGNKSLRECVRKGTKKSGKLICMLEIK